MSTNQRKERAISLRKQGKSYRDIELELGIARSTLSGWLRDIPLTAEQRGSLHERWVAGTARARLLAGLAHQRMRKDRLALVDVEANKYVSAVVINKDILTMLFVGLYLGDGFKNNGRVGLGNADPEIVLLFVTLLRKLHAIDESKLRAQIFARADQSESELRAYWSSLLDIPSAHFHKTQFDKRTINVETRQDYHGVCAVVYADTLLQHRILAIGQEMIKYVGTLQKGS